MDCGVTHDKTHLCSSEQPNKFYSRNNEAYFVVMRIAPRRRLDRDWTVSLGVADRRTHTRMHTHTHARTHARTHTHTHTHTCTHAHTKVAPAYTSYQSDYHMHI